MSDSSKPGWLSNLLNRLDPAFILGALISLSFWVSGIYYGTNSNASEIQKLKDVQQVYSENLSQIKTDIAVIKEILNGKRHGR